MGNKDRETEKKKKKRKKRKKEMQAEPVQAPAFTYGGEVLPLIKPSSFKALNSAADLTVTSNYPFKMQFSTKQFDLANEYNTETSTFIPKTNGIYLILATIPFKAFDPNGDVRTRIEVRRNGNQAAAMEHDFFSGDSRNMAAISTILQLQAGDEIEIFAQRNVSGTFFATDNDSRFEAVRFPF